MGWEYAAYGKNIPKSQVQSRRDEIEAMLISESRGRKEVSQAKSEGRSFAVWVDW